MPCTNRPASVAHHGKKPAVTTTAVPVGDEPEVTESLQPAEQVAAVLQFTQPFSRDVGPMPARNAHGSMS